MIRSGVVQGLGLGLVFVPLSTVAFATLEPRFRADATSLFRLVRNIGVKATLARNVRSTTGDSAPSSSPSTRFLRRSALPRSPAIRRHCR